jgi:ATP-dependent DNA ligase
MLATLVDSPFDDKAWVFETKWDGFRLVTEKRGHTLRLWSRLLRRSNGHPIFLAWILAL